MAFCGQCGLLLTTNTTNCPRCGAATDSNASVPEISEDDNSTTLMAHTSGSAPYAPYDTIKATYTPPEGNTYPEQRADQTNHAQSDIYPPSRGFQHSFPQSGSNYMAPDASAPNSPFQGSNPVPGIYQRPTPPRKTSKWPFILIIVLIVALVAVTAMLFAVGSNSFARLFGANNTPTTQLTPTAPPATTAQQNTPTATQPSPTTTATASTLQAQATIQQYYSDINKQDYQDAYNLWVSNPDNYTHYKQGFAHTHHDDITFGDAIPQIDGTVQINITLQATEDAAGGGTKISTYQGYYIVGQQADGSWKIISGQFT